MRGGVSDWQGGYRAGAMLHLTHAYTKPVKADKECEVPVVLLLA